MDTKLPRCTAIVRLFTLAGPPDLSWRVFRIGIFYAILGVIRMALRSDMLKPGAEVFKVRMDVLFALLHVSVRVGFALVFFPKLHLR
jgi:hypothetical protein